MIGVDGAADGSRADDRADAPAIDVVAKGSCSPAVVPEDVEAGGPPGDPEETARIVCLRLLDRRAYTRAELEKALRKRGVPDDAAARTLARFAELGLIDDAALADGYAQAVHRERGLAGRAVAQRLRQRGVAENQVRSAVATIDHESELAAAHALVQRRLRSMGSLEPQVQARRLVGLLARKGYSPSLAHDVVRAEIRAKGAELAELGEIS